MSVLRLKLALAVLLTSACSGRPPSYVYLEYLPYMYSGEEIRLIHSYEKGFVARIDLKVTNQRSNAVTAKQFTLERGATFVLKLTPDALPGLGTATSSIERYGIAADVEIPGNYWDGVRWATPKSAGLTTEFAVITDLEARLPVFSRVPLIGVGPPGGQPDPWNQVEDKGPMEDAALQAATERGGRELAVTSRLASSEEVGASRTPNLSSLGAEIYRFEVSGKFPKQVVVKGHQGNRDESVVTPTGFKMLVPRVARPVALDVEPILP